MYNPQLDAFIMVADRGSFSKAAKAMYISAPAVIQQVNLLEKSCGFKLFSRSNHGVELTSAGHSLYRDAKAIIKLSDEAVKRAALLAESSETTVRIGTSLLYKCRMLPDLWPQVSETYPNLKIEILSMSGYRNRSELFKALGTEFDLFEGIYGTAGWNGLCRFLELKRTPVCCAVSSRHRLSGMKKLTMQDLHGECLVMPAEGTSREIDTLRKLIHANDPSVRITDSRHYDLNTFTLCELNDYVLITQPVYSDIHSNLITIPLETDITMPYGLIYSNNPTPATERFIGAVKKLRERK